MKVVVHHIGPSCVQCNQTKRVLDQMKVPYTEVDLRDHQDLTEKFKQLGHLTAPIVTVGSDLIWSGFKLERLRALGLIDHAENKS